VIKTASLRCRNLGPPEEFFIGARPEQRALSSEERLQARRLSHRRAF
jgi:hypothetical protein